MLVDAQMFAGIGIGPVDDASGPPVDRFSERSDFRRLVTVGQYERDRSSEGQQQARLPIRRVMNVHKVYGWHQAIGRNGRPDRRSDRHVVDQVESFRELDIPDQYVLLYAELLQRFYQFNEMFTGTVERLCQVDMTDIHAF